MTHEIILQSQEEAVKLLGQNGELRKRIQQEVPVRIVDRGAKILILGESRDTTVVTEMLNQLLVAVRSGHTPTVDDVEYALSGARSNHTQDLGNMLGETPSVLRNDLFVKSRTHGQKRYLEALRNYELVIVIGPAGTGKTYLAMAAAVSALLNKEVNNLVLTRPAVEAGESLGFLPGDVNEKVNPYLRPLYDALYSMVDRNRARKLFERDQIEVAPLAFMRGRTLSRCFAILDEAQNTTSEQMKMFLTRLGEGSRAVITGDITQIDLAEGTPSGLIEASRILKNTEGVAVVNLSGEDIVRHRLVQSIVEAYEFDESKVERSGAGSHPRGRGAEAADSTG